MNYKFTVGDIVSVKNHISNHEILNIKDGIYATKNIETGTVSNWHFKYFQSECYLNKKIMRKLKLEKIFLKV